MSLKALFGIESSNITEAEIMLKLKNAIDRRVDQIEFIGANGSKTSLRISQVDYTKQIEPWDNVLS